MQMDDESKSLTAMSTFSTYQAIAENGQVEDSQANSEDASEAHLELDDDVTPTTSPPTAASSLTAFQAMIHLVKGNLGPGCLNLPHAFARTGWGLSVGLFGLVAAQGIYSMYLLVYCKRALNNSGQPSKSFMDVSQASLGSAGRRLVEVFLVILQGGVCCVFLSLISTNLVAMTSISDNFSIVLVTLLLLVIVLLRFIRDLTWLSATANALMITAIATATIAGLVHFSATRKGNDDAAPRTSIANPTPSNIVTFVSDMFFAFEGIGLVLPIENTYNTAHREQSTPFDSVLTRSMMFTAGLFVCVGLSASVGFPDIQSGSVTAYLEERYPKNVWFSMVNAFVMVAVLFTFPLQLQPAMEVIDRWLDHGCPQLQAAIARSSSNNDIGESTGEGDGVMRRESTYTSSLDRRRCGIKRWIYRRWLVVFCCALIVFYVNNLSVLISLFGAIGQTGLAGMPCAIHLALQREGVVPKSFIRTSLDIFILVFCSTVMVSGVVACFAG
jgi:amino acid permease